MMKMKKDDELMMEDDDPTAGYAADNEGAAVMADAEMEDDMDFMEDETADAAPTEEAALADVVPDANTDPNERIKALEAQLASVMESMKTPEPAATESPDMAGEAMPAEDEWATFENDYPDIAIPIKKWLEARMQATDSRMNEFDQRVSAADMYRFEDSMDAARPDWRDLRDDPAFGEWMKANPDQQQAANVPGVRAALKVLKAYDESRTGNDIASARQKRLEGATATPTKGGRAPSLSDSLDGWAAA